MVKNNISALEIKFISSCHRVISSIIYIIGVICIHGVFVLQGISVLVANYCQMMLMINLKVSYFLQAFALGLYNWVSKVYTLAVSYKD